MGLSLLKYTSSVLAFLGLPLILNAQIALGLGGTYGSDIDQFAPNFRAYYFPTHHICFGPEYSWFPSIESNDVKRQLTEFNLTGHYLLEISHRTALYPLTGLNYSREKETENGEEETTDAFGLNLGAGVHFAYGRVLPFAEYKYIFSDLSQHVISIGILIVVQEKGQSENTDH
ncbi:MAG: hypothetical protein O6848_02605 [Bacteroidetes bacterium]|nr:hypothetical protein [Bacteroidota bacterium]